MKKLTTAALILCVLCSSCSLIGVLGTPMHSERKIPAEFRLKDHAGEGLLVFVDTAGSSNAPLDLRARLGESIELLLTKKARIKKSNLVSRDNLLFLLDKGGDFARRSPVEVARQLEAGPVLYVLVENCRLTQMVEQDYYSGSLDSYGILFEVSTGRTLWPESGRPRPVKIKVEFETNGREVTVNRLTRATAHCIVRNLYDIPINSFKITDERIDAGF